MVWTTLGTGPAEDVKLGWKSRCYTATYVTPRGSAGRNKKEQPSSPFLDFSDSTQTELIQPLQ